MTEDTPMMLQTAAQGSALVLEQVGQDETRRFGFHAVNPEVRTAGVVLVTSVHELEIVRLRVKGLQRICARQGEKKK